VAEADVGGIQEGQPVEFTVDAYPYRTFHGDVIQVRNSPTTVNNVVTYDAVISVTNSDYKLKPGMTANVSVIVAERSNALKIPNAAMRFRPPETALVITNGIADPPATNLAATMPPGQRAKLKGNRNLRTVYLLVTDNGADKLKQVQVKTGINDGISTEVLDGLAEGDKLVVGILNPGATGTGAGSSPFGGGGFPRR